jgi:hypothetical protein
MRHGFAGGHVHDIRRDGALEQHFEDIHDSLWRAEFSEKLLQALSMMLEQLIEARVEPPEGTVVRG